MLLRCCFLKSLSENFKLNNTDISLPAFLSRSNLKLHSIPLTTKTVKKVAIDLHFSKLAGPDYIPVVFLKKGETELSYKLVDLFIMCLN